MPETSAGNATPDTETAAENTEAAAETAEAGTATAVAAADSSEATEAEPAPPATDAPAAAEGSTTGEVEAGEQEADEPEPPEGAVEVAARAEESAPPEAEEAAEGESSTEGAEPAVEAVAESTEPEAQAAAEGTEPEAQAAAEGESDEGDQAEAAPAEGAAAEATPAEGAPEEAEAASEETVAAVGAAEGKQPEKQPEKKARRKRKKKAKAEAGSESGEKPPESPEARFFRQAKEADEILEGRVIGWNRGGFHVVINDTTTFCPRSEMEVREPRKPESYVDQTLPFRVLKVQDRGRRVVVSRAAALRAEHARKAQEVLEDVAVGDVVKGTVASIADFGAFVDLGGVKGLVHVSEISRDQVDHPKDRLQVGQQVEVKILKVQEDGRRISLSMKALEPDPWKGVRERYPEGSVVSGTVERTNRYGAFIRLEPGMTGLLPSSEMKLPPDAQAARIFPPGREVKVHVLSVDPRRRRISLGQEGSKAEGSAADLKQFKKQQADASGGFNALAAAFKKIE